MFDGKLVTLKPEDIIPKNDQPRKSFDEYELKKLSVSIKENGILQPLIVRRAEKGKYLLIAGERRLRAAKMAGVKKIPCIIRSTDDLTADLYTIIENLQRRDLSVFEEAEGISRLICCHGLSQTEVSERLGIAPSTLSNKLRLLKLGERLKERIIAAGLTERHARALLRLEGSERQKAALAAIIREDMTVAQTEEYIETLLRTPEKPPAPRSGKATYVVKDVRLFLNSLRRSMETMRLAGVDAVCDKQESEEEIIMTIRIPKQSAMRERAEEKTPVKAL